MSVNNLWNNDRLDHSEVEFIQRVIASAGKDSGDPLVFAEYKEQYLGMSRALRFRELDVTDLREQ